LPMIRGNAGEDTTFKGKGKKSGPGKTVVRSERRMFHNKKVGGGRNTMIEREKKVTNKSKSNWARKKETTRF